MIDLLQKWIPVATVFIVVISSNPMAAQVSPTTQKSARVRIMHGPELESTGEYLTIIRWETNNPGGSPVHYGVVHYGTDPRKLSETAKNPIRLNPAHPSTVFRVRLEGLRAGTTYYYTVDSMEANGTDDGTASSVHRFTIPSGSQNKVKSPAW